MKNNRRKPGFSKEKFFMIASSAFILTAFTLTGFYVSDHNESEKDGYLIDFSDLEKQQSKTEKEQQNDKNELEEISKQANSIKVRNANKKNAIKNDNEKTEVIHDVDDAREPDSIVVQEKQGEAVTVDTKTVVNEEKDLQKKYSFSSDETLAWPIVGNVLMDYSMDKAVYFSTMQQYRYNPAIIISAKEGEPITTATDCRVKSVFKDTELGNGIIFELGDGYELTYGQLKDITVKEGEQLEKGQLVGYVSNPSIYYSQEGINLYVKLTKDGVPMDPIQVMGETEE